MATVGRAATDVVDRARRLGDEVGQGGSVREGTETSLAVTAADPNAARTCPASASTTTASEQTAITMAFRGPTFMKV